MPAMQPRVRNRDNQSWFSLLKRGLSYIRDKAFYSTIYAAVRSIFAGLNPTVFISFFITATISGVVSDAITHFVPINQIVTGIYTPIAGFLGGVLPARILEVLHLIIPGIIGGLMGGITIGLPMHYFFGDGIAAGLRAIPGYSLRDTAAQFAKSAISRTNYLSREDTEIIGNALGHALADTLMDYQWPMPSSEPSSLPKNNLGKQSANVTEGNVYAFFNPHRPAVVAPRVEESRSNFAFSS